MNALDLKPGLTVTTPWNTEVLVTQLLADTVPLARAALQIAAQLGLTVTYGQLSKALDGCYPPIGLGSVLDLISCDCASRGEPSLAALVVRGDTNESSVDWDDVGGADAALQQCYAYWA